jgi:hypothetical protein
MDERGRRPSAGQRAGRRTAGPTRVNYAKPRRSGAIESRASDGPRGVEDVRRVPGGGVGRRHFSPAHGGGRRENRIGDYEPAGGRPFDRLRCRHRGGLGGGLGTAGPVAGRDGGRRVMRRTDDGDVIPARRAGRIRAAEYRYRGQDRCADGSGESELEAAGHQVTRWGSVVNLAGPERVCQGNWPGRLPPRAAGSAPPGFGPSGCAPPSARRIPLAKRDGGGEHLLRPVLDS